MGARVDGAGDPAHDVSAGRGDQLVYVQVDIPTKLSDEQRILFAQLAVFNKSFDVAAAQSVFGHNPHDLVALAHANLIQALGDERWRMLEPIRQYAGEMFAQTSETGLEDTRLLHAIYFAEVAQAARRGDPAAHARLARSRSAVDGDHRCAALGQALAHSRDRQYGGDGQEGIGGAEDDAIQSFIIEQCGHG